MATATNNANTTLTKAEDFNLDIRGLGYLSNMRRIETLTGAFLSVVINALSGPTDNPTYVRFDATVAGKEATDLISRCQKAGDLLIIVNSHLSWPTEDDYHHPR